MIFSTAAHFYYYTSLFVVITFMLLIPQMPALKCKCSQSSSKTPCNNGVCEVSDNSACLMLDHPKNGRHYACSTSELPEGECAEKVSKAGTTIKVCACNSSNFCNFKLWPKQSDDLDIEDEELRPSTVSDKVEMETVKKAEEHNAGTDHYMSLFTALITPLIVFFTFLL